MSPRFHLLYSILSTEGLVGFILEYSQPSFFKILFLYLPFSASGSVEVCWGLSLIPHRAAVFSPPSHPDRQFAGCLPRNPGAPLVQVQSFVADSGLCLMVMQGCSKSRHRASGQCGLGEGLPAPTGFLREQISHKPQPWVVTRAEDHGRPTQPSLSAPSRLWLPLRVRRLGVVAV